MRDFRIHLTQEEAPILVLQFIMTLEEEANMGVRVVPRLFCHDCFTEEVNGTAFGGSDGEGVGGGGGGAGGVAEGDDDDDDGWESVSDDDDDDGGSDGGSGDPPPFHAHGADPAKSAFAKYAHPFMKGMKAAMNFKTGKDVSGPLSVYDLFSVWDYQGQMKAAEALAASIFQKYAM